jgi:hypothetical protein
MNEEKINICVDKIVKKLFSEGTDDFCRIRQGFWDYQAYKIIKEVLLLELRNNDDCYNGTTD